MLFLPGGIAVSYSAVPLMLASFSDPLDMPLCSNLCLWLSQSFAGHSASPKIVICYLKTAELEFKFCPNSNSLLAIIPFPFINFYQVTRQHWGSNSNQGVDSALQKHIWEPPQTLVGESYWAVNTSWTSGSFHMLKEVLQFYSSDLYIVFIPMSFCNNSGTHHEIS